MTELYTHQRPLQVFEPHAIDLHWGHSILVEPTFLAPWSAIDQAADLALEFGEPSHIVVTNFALPSSKRMSMRSKSVSFAEHVQVFPGKDVVQKFHAEWTCLNDRDQDADAVGVPHYVYGRQAATEATGSSAPDPSSPAPVSHILDRRLPNDLARYIHHLQQLWRDDHIRVQPGEHYSLRTWFIHHVHQRCWKVPRVVRLPDDPRLWHDLLLRTWRDQLHNDEPLNVAVAFPRVRSRPATVAIHADVILTQGAHDECGGLVTVYPPGSEDDMHYVWAASYPRHVSGWQILDGVEAGELVQTHACDLFHGGVVVPVTTQPTHVMANGHSFVAVFHDLAGATLPSSSSNVVPNDHSVIVPDAIADDVHNEDTAEESPAVTSSSFDDDDLQGVQVFGLQQPVHHCFVRWSTYNVLLFDILHSIVLHRDLAVGHHYIPVQLVDQHDAEEAVILQRVGDVPSGSSDRLVLVDIVYQTRAGQQRSYHRRVRLLPQQLSRNEVFVALNLQNPCVQYPDACQFFCNDVIWPPDELLSRELRHGAYIRIVVRRDGHTECPLPTDDGTFKRRRLHSDTAGSSSVFPDQDSASLFQSAVVIGSRAESHLMFDSQRSFATTSEGLPGGSIDGQDHSQPRACSATFSSLAATYHSSSDLASAPVRPTQARDQQWMLPMRMAFAEFLTSSARDTSHEMMVTTWYLHHVRLQRSTESRLLSLDEHHTLWYHDLCDLWADVMDPTQEAQVHFVRFGSLSDSEHPVPIHLLFVQGYSPLVPVLLTALFEHEVLRRVWHVAALVPEFISATDVWEILGTNRFCAHRICHLMVTGRRVPQQEVLQTQCGDHLRVTIMPQQVDAEIDGVSFMQNVASSSLNVDVCPTASRSALPIGSLDDNRWRDGLADSFHTSAVVEVEEEGSVLYVWTWFLHHQSFRQCDHPRIVRLGRCDNEWLNSLLDPWQAHLQPDAPTQIRVIHARPHHDMMKIDTVHIMIEQLPAEPVIAGVVSVIFHEDTKDRLLQRALSLPRWLCTDDLVNIMELNPICELQRCSARVGRIPLEHFIRHDLPSAVSVEMHIQPAQCHGDPHAASSGCPYVPRPLLPVSGRSLMQTTRRWQRARRQRAAASEVEPDDHVEDEHHLTPQRVAACASPLPQQQPMIAPMWPTTWTHLHDVWSFFFNQMTLPDGMQIRVAVWYSDHLRRPWSDDYRLVPLDAQLETWPTRIVQAWQDWFLADQPFDIHVVHPVPLGANEEAQFHVILLQQPDPLHKSVIVTVMDSVTDPWQPGQLAVVVPNAIDHWVLLHVAVVEFQCPPVILTAQCSTSFGHTDLTAGNLFPVRHGMCFTVTVDTTTTTTSVRQIPISDMPSDVPTLGLHLLQLRARLCDTHRHFEQLQWQSRALSEIFTKAEDYFQSSTLPHVVTMDAASDNIPACQLDPDDTRALPPLSQRVRAVRNVTPYHSKMQNDKDANSVVDKASPRDDPSVLYPICLDDLVPPPIWTSVDCSLIEALRHRLCRLDPPAVQFDLTAIQCTPSTVDALHGMLHWTVEVPLAFEFYTDGAFRRSQNVAASGVVLIVYTYDGPRFGGYLTAWCFSDPSAPRAEVTAVTLAVHWACHLVLKLGFAYTKIGFLFDNVYAGASAQGRCASALNYDLVPIVRSLTLWLEQITFVDIVWSHVQGHSNHPWNDLADAVAYGAIANNYVATDICALVQCCCCGDNASVALQWL